ncbi:MAG TPA: S16 family serine protease, partial [Limnochordia bacterium]|nr:S16 family serine protease [Limnochordia bacterium]
KTSVPKALGGPSAGLAMALAAAGVDPAGCVVVTGALNFDGSVRTVGGLPQKVSATANGHCRFVYPRSESDQERAAADKLGVALDAQAVASFAEALAALGGAARGEKAAGGLH